MSRRGRRGKKEKRIAGIVFGAVVFLEVLNGIWSGDTDTTSAQNGDFVEASSGTESTGDAIDSSILDAETATGDESGVADGDAGAISTETIGDSTWNPVEWLDLPAYAGYASVELNEGMPYFDVETIDVESDTWELTELDSLGRCGTAYGYLGSANLATEERGNIGMVKPSGWHTVKYNDLIDGNYLYNRCHLLGYQLTGINADERNLITGTRYLNVVGMLPYENEIADYIEDTGNHVLYRVTPIFEGDNLVASGVLMEAYSVEDSGAGVCFSVYCFNVQPGIAIDYATGDSWEDASVVAYDYSYN